jgi:glycosyltransferase involved in cell wall biosynthesis
VVEHQSTPVEVSIVIPAYGRAERLRALVAQLLDQELDCAQVEIIVVDDGSPEPVAPVLAESIGGSAAIVKVLRRENGGPAVARNFGAAAARGDLLLFVDDDLSVPRDLVQQHLAVQRECGPALVNCALEWKIEAEPAPFARWYRSRTDDWGRARAADGRPVGDRVFEITAPLASTANLSIRRTDFARLGGFDEDYPYGCEDQDFAGRADRAGVPILFSTRTTALHVETHNTLGKLCRRQQFGARDTVRFLKRFAVEERLGRPEIAKFNDPLTWTGDGAALASKKTLRWLITAPVIRAMTFGLIGIYERLAPNSKLLGRVYDLMVGAYVQKGWRDGRRLYAAVEPLEEWKPGAATRTEAVNK